MLIARLNPHVAAAVRAALAAGLVLGSAQVFAQDVAGAANEDLGEVIVTAQKRAERLQDVPLAVTAVTAEGLTSRQINDTNTLVKAVPSLSYQQGANPTNTSFRIRGVGTSLFGQGTEPSVSVVVDGVVMPRGAMGFSDLADIERVEVLRGPQGTLFGKNATAGLINVVTARPSSEFSGRAQVTAAQRGEYRVNGTLTGALAEGINGRITAFYNNVDGHMRNITTGRDVNGFESSGARVKLEFARIENLNLLLTAEYRKNDALCCASLVFSEPNPIAASLLLPNVPTWSNRTTTENKDTRTVTSQKTVSLQADYDMGWGTMTSISAYQGYHLWTNQPVDRSNSSVVRFVGAGAAYSGFDLNAGTARIRNLSQELRIASNGQNDLNYVVGLFWNSLDITRPFTRDRAVCASGVIGQPCAVTPVIQSASSVTDLEQEHYAIFGQADYRIAGGLKAILGLRAQKEQGTNFGVRWAPNNPGEVVFPGHAPITGSKSSGDTAITGKAGLQYEFGRDAQVYASFTRGYKGEGYEMEIAGNFADQGILQPETVKAYEIGFKGRTPGGMLSGSVALFQADYRNLQVQANRSDANTGIIRFVSTNAGKSQTRGVELEGALRLGQSFRIDGGVTYAPTTIDIDGLSCPLQFQGAAPILTANFPVNSCYRLRNTVNGVTNTSGPIQDLRGKELAGAPKWRASIAPRFEHELGFANLGAYVQASVNYSSKFQWAVEQDPLLVQRAYTTVDLTVGFYDASEKYNLSLFVKNLFDADYYTSLSHGTLLATTAQPNAVHGTINKDTDRYFGASFGMKF